MKPVAIFRHSPTEGPGYFAIFLEQQGIPWQLIAIDEDELPAVPWRELSLRKPPDDDDLEDDGEEEDVQDGKTAKWDTPGASSTAPSIVDARTPTASPPVQRAQFPSPG